MDEKIFNEIRENVRKEFSEKIANEKNNSESMSDLLNIVLNNSFDYTDKMLKELFINR